MTNKSGSGGRSSAVGVIVYIMGMAALFAFSAVTYFKARSVDKEVNRLTRKVEIWGEDKVEPEGGGDQEQQVALLKNRLAKVEAMLESLSRQGASAPGESEVGEVSPSGGGELTPRVVLEAISQLMEDEETRKELKTALRGNRREKEPQMDKEQIKENMAGFKERRKELLEQVERGEMTEEDAKAEIQAMRKDLRDMGVRFREPGRRGGRRGNREARSARRGGGESNRTE